ncbi:ParA family protein [Magnetofaba australis]|uniref:Putative cobyrinic acid a,c-diamide synthase n=1 Tax=Magnetofaba australis IT-1 TaxID=1434232 RepID=A0A1Y2K7C4_9PROT|nr:ParA family protein [Magnetofaba australis]OSM04361.1 putative cobyrinic acid a,c-diamide synthase [Magnetofaba australis IT-1]
MKIYAVYNLKGGVGKTTTAVNLAWLSAQEGARTLLWDLDPQGSSSYYMCVSPKVKGGLKGLIRRKHDLDDLLRMSGYANLDVLPADLSYRNLDIHLHHAKHGEEALLRILKPLRQSYDRVILDCPPGLSALAENIFRMSDALTLPMIPTTLSLKAYNRLIEFLNQKRSEKLKVLPFFNQVSAAKPIHKVVSRTVPLKHPAFLKATIPDSNLIEAMGMKRAPLLAYAPTSEEAQAYRNLWSAILARTDPDSVDERGKFRRFRIDESKKKKKK